MKLICTFCHSSFDTYRSKRKFCSTKCANSFHCSKRKNGKILFCNECSTPFYRSAWYENKSRFCSRICLTSYITREITPISGFQKSKSKKSRRKYRHCRVNGKTKSLHRHIMEEHLGRSLKRYEHVHHINNDPLDNRLENLIVLIHGEHSKLTCEENNNFRRTTI